MRTSSASTRSPHTAPPARITLARFSMRPGDQHQQQQPPHSPAGPGVGVYRPFQHQPPSSPRWMQEASDQARDTMNWLRYAVEHPDDVTAVAIGRIVSKEYGAHERAHTEQHRWRSSSSSSSTTASLQPPPSPRPASPGAAARPPASASEGGTRAAGWQAWAAGQLGEAGRHDATASPAFTPHSPPCGPGFLRHQQEQQRSGEQQQ